MSSEASFSSTIAAIAPPPVARDDATVAARIGELDGEEREPLAAPRQRRDAASVFALDQRHVAAQHERRAVVVEERRGLLQRMAGAELRLLANEREPRCVRALLDLVGTVAGDDDGARRPQPGNGAENMLQ